MPAHHRGEKIEVYLVEEHLRAASKAKASDYSRAGIGSYGVSYLHVAWQAGPNCMHAGIDGFGMD